VTEPGSACVVGEILAKVERTSKIEHHKKRSGQTLEVEAGEATPLPLVQPATSGCNHILIENRRMVKYYCEYDADAGTGWSH
jgi:hypothetical protein